MTNKVDQSGFQLNKKELLTDVPLMLKAVVGSFIDYVNALDANHDGKADIEEIAPIIIKALPVIQALLPLVDNEAFLQWFISHDFIKDKAAATTIITKLVALIPKK